MQVYVEPLLTSVIKGKYNSKSDKYFLELKLSRDPTSSTSDLYEFNIYLFHNGDKEEFLFFVHNFNMTRAASMMLEMGTKVQ